MTKKEQAIKNVRDHLKILESLPDYIFDIMFNANNSKTISQNDITPKRVYQSIKEIKTSPTVQYGTNINSVRDMLKVNADGMTKSQILDSFPNGDQYPEAELYTIVTNVLSSLNKGGEVEKYKPRNKKMRGYYWKLKL